MPAVSLRAVWLSTKLCVYYQFTGGLGQIITPLGLFPTQSPGHLDSLFLGFPSFLFLGSLGGDQSLFMEQMIWWG